MIDFLAWLENAKKLNRTITTSVHNKHASPPANGKYIGRGSACGNPYPIDNAIGQTREVVIQRYAEHSPALMKSIMSMKGQALVCFCAPRICHGDVIAILCEGLETDPVIAGRLVTEAGLTIAKIKAALGEKNKSAPAEIEYE